MRSASFQSTGESTLEWNRQLTAAYSASSTSAFVEAAFGFLRATVSCDVLWFYDLVGGQEFSNLLDSNCGLRHPAASRAALVFNPACVYANASLRGVRETLPGGPARRSPSPLHAEMVRPAGPGHTIGILFWDTTSSPLPESAFCLYRAPGQSGFSEHDLTVLETARLHLAAALNCLKSRLAGCSKHDGLAAIVRNLPLGSILLNWHLEFMYANRAGMRNWVAWLPGDAAENLKFHRKDHTVPAEIENACRELQRDWTAGLKNKSRPKFRKRRVEHRTQPGMHATVTLLCQRDASISRPGFLIQMEQRRPARFAIPWTRAVQLDLLTVSEREVVVKAIDGLSNQEIASQLGKTVCAVKFLLHSTFKKLQLPNRARLIAYLRDVATPEQLDNVESESAWA